MLNHLFHLSPDSDSSLQQQTREIREFRRMMLRHPPMNNQRAVGLFLSRGYHDSLVLLVLQ